MSEEKTQTVNPPMHHIDYKDITRLSAHVNPHARMMNRRRTGMSAKGQRNFPRTTKRAILMVLSPKTQYGENKKPTGTQGAPAGFIIRT
jgi:ribosomal protein S18